MEAVGGFYTPGRMMKIGVALFFDFLKLILSLAIMFAPLILGGVAGIYVNNQCASVLGTSEISSNICAAAGTAAGSLVTIGGYMAEFGTGIGAAAVEAAGEVLADSVDIAAWCLFFIWFAVTGVKFFGGQRAMRRFFFAITGLAAGLIPFINVGPTITIAVIAIEYQDWREKRESAATKEGEVRTREQKLAVQREAFQQAQQRAADWNLQALIDAE